jgi:hypothetical protein
MFITFEFPAISREVTRKKEKIMDTPFEAHILQLFKEARGKEIPARLKSWLADCPVVLLNARGEGVSWNSPDLARLETRERRSTAAAR